MSAVHLANDDQTPRRPAGSSTPEPFVTLHKAADAIGLKYYHLLRAVNRGDVPSYRWGTKRQWVRLSEIEAAILAHRR